MNRQLLIIGVAAPSADHWIKELREAIPGLSCIYSGGESIDSGRPFELPPDLTLLVAGGLKQDAPGVLRVFLATPRVAPLIAILPESAQGELVAMVTRAADDFVFAPARPGELRRRVVRLLGQESAEPIEPDAAEVAERARETLTREIALAGMIGQTPAFLKTLAKIPFAAKSTGPVLVVGETGTGKELCARALHAMGPRSGFPFIAVDCAALPDQLFENEMFGHAAGAYTDARRDQKGLVALAEGGTLFLDEINSLSLVAQSKLLRFLQERTYRPLGSNGLTLANVNVVAATNCDLASMVRRNLFRSDLFFRLNVFRLDLVPLRERREDIPLLARHFAATLCAGNGLAHKTLAPSTLRVLEEHEWPGNVRELYNVIHRAVIFSQGSRILPSDVTDGAEPARPEEAFTTFRQARSRAVASFEKRYVEDLMRQCDGNVSHAARLAKKDRRSFGRLVKRYAISREHH